ncbi:ribosomal protein L7/L12 [Nitrogeniibacter mangrovi]|uniref:ribosomal protein L7/L12 n=1 Tax=Nitrogeniibacter mangrovi TaxID=2016596 RepID=UPI00156EB3E4|nr:ribosomal protein L7/L12 [Nitrogeniibacter mangrovi]
MSEQPLPPAAEDALARGRVIEAIKIVREVEGIGLKEAKERVDGRRHAGPGAGVGFAGPGERRNPLVLVVLLLLVLALAWYVMRT